MRSRVASETLPCPLITRDTVAVDTCASRATSLRVTPIPSPGQRASVYIQHVSACLNASWSVLLQPGLSRNGAGATRCPARLAAASVTATADQTAELEPLAMRGAICCGAIRHTRSPRRAMARHGWKEHSHGHDPGNVHRGLYAVARGDQPHRHCLRRGGRDRPVARAEVAGLDRSLSGHD